MLQGPDEEIRSILGEGEVSPLWYSPYFHWPLLTARFWGFAE
jgi:hypothetical protein